MIAASDSGGGGSAKTAQQNIGVENMAATLLSLPRHGTNRESANERFLAAAAADDHRALRQALSDGALINVRSEDSETALMHAARGGRLGTAELLLELGASLDLQDKHGRTALSHAVLSGHCALADILIRMGADITLDDKNGDKPLDAALRSGQAAMVALFEQPLKDLLSRIPSADSGPKLQYRIAPACAPDPHGDTMLTWAAREGQESVVRAMVQAGADVSMRNRAGQSPLEVAQAAGHELIVHMLEEAEMRRMQAAAASLPAADTGILQ